MGKGKKSSRPEWEMLSGFPSCACNTKPENLPDNLPPGMPSACSHLYVKKSAVKDLFDVSLSPATLGSREGSPRDGGEAEKPQGVRVLRGGPVSIVIYPMPPPTAGQPLPRTSVNAPTFASLADERAADDMGVLLMGGVSRATSPAGSRRRATRSAADYRSRPTSVDGRPRKNCNLGSVTVSALLNQYWMHSRRGYLQLPGPYQLKMPSHAYEVDIKLDKVIQDRTAQSPNVMARPSDSSDSSEANRKNCNNIRLYKHTISSLISSRIVDMNKQARMLQELRCKCKGAHKPHPLPLLGKNSKKNIRSIQGLYNDPNKHYPKLPCQFSFH